MLRDGYMFASFLINVSARQWKEAQSAFLWYTMTNSERSPASKKFLPRSWRGTDKPRVSGGGARTTPPPQCLATPILADSLMVLEKSFKSE
ncbi:hypothetical protein [Rhizobium sp. ICMP 5592]|uniref:hypothetical protein n=1 Tax=Rhizobium sp. ICMP 5592 TaxID=2292445 RepID=UPI001294FB40|nr:hypothetical protein [Rhizobium sp. ICMP 5592]